MMHSSSVRFAAMRLNYTTATRDSCSNGELLSFNGQKLPVCAVALMAVRTATVLTAVSKSRDVITCDLLFDQTGDDMIADCKRQSLLACSD